MATAADVAAANQWNTGTAAKSVLATQYGWTPDEVMQLQARGIGPVNLAQMKMDNNASQMLRTMIAPATSASTTQDGGGTQATARPSYLGQSPQISYGSGDSSASSGGGGTTGATGGGGGTTMADGSGLQPEQIALEQQQQIDPTGEALRRSLAGSYLTSLQQAGAPTAGQFQSYLDLYRQIDPTGAAARTQLGQDLASQEALGTQLDPATQREVEQATRLAQGARGNVYGTPQLVQEAMTRGQAGLALQQQRQQALQSYLGSGQTMGDVAMNLYNQQQNQLRAAQGAGLGYLGSGQTAYQTGASYYDRAQQAAVNAAAGGPQYQPSALGQNLSGSAQQFPQYGLDMSQLAGNWYNNINAANLQAYGLSQGGQRSGSGQRAAAGALGGAASGALAGSAAGGVGAIPGALIGALGGAASGYFS